MRFVLILAPHLQSTFHAPERAFGTARIRKVSPPRPHPHPLRSRSKTDGEVGPPSRARARTVTLMYTVAPIALFARAMVFAKPRSESPGGDYKRHKRWLARCPSATCNAAPLDRSESQFRRFALSPSSVCTSALRSCRRSRSAANYSSNLCYPNSHPFARRRVAFGREHASNLERSALSLS